VPGAGAHPRGPAYADNGETDALQTSGRDAKAAGFADERVAAAHRRVNWTRVLAYGVAAGPCVATWRWRRDI